MHYVYSIYKQYSSDTTELFAVLNHVLSFVACGSFSGSFIEYFAHDMSKFCCTIFVNNGTTE